VLRKFDEKGRLLSRIELVRFGDGRYGVWRYFRQVSNIDLKAARVYAKLKQPLL
jgi:hypothetical protein